MPHQHVPSLASGRAGGDHARLFGGWRIRRVSLRSATRLGRPLVFVVGFAAAHSAAIAAPGTLTIGGDLVLTPTTVLNYELGAPGTVGGPSNDLIIVGGDLTLDGTLNVTAFGPNYGPGYYRLFNYAGSLTDNGLAMGSIAGGYSATALTNIDHQVNLRLGTATQIIQYWDGSDTTGVSTGSGATGGDGGSGTWNAANTNWTAPTGYGINDSWKGQVGVFAGTAGGTVTIVGVQQFEELRFQTDSYNLVAGSGGGLGTTGGFSVIDVGTNLAATIAAPISGTGGLTKTGAGRLVLTGTNNYSGDTSLAAGTVQIGSPGALGGGDVLFEGGSLRSAATMTLANDIAWQPVTSSILSAAPGTTLTLTGDFQVRSVNDVHPTLRFGTPADTGTIILATDQTSLSYINTTTSDQVLAVEGGTLRAGNDDLGAFTAFLGTTRIDAGATLDFAGQSGTDATVRNLQGAGTLTNSANTRISAGSFAGAITGAGSMTKTGAGTLLLTGTNSYAGTTTISAGTLQVGGGGTTGTLGSGDIVNNATLVFNRSDTLTVAGRISGSGPILKTAPGTLVLAGSNGSGIDYTGTTTVAAGTLRLDGDFGDSTNGLASLLVQSGGSVGGTGSFLGSTTVQDGGRIAPGASPGTLTVGGDLTLAAGTILDYELGAPGVVGGPNNDLIVVGGDLTLDGTLNVTGFGPGYGPGYYRLINYDGTLTDNGLAIGSIDGGLAATVFTDIAHQVNLRLGGGAQIVQYWDGSDTGASAVVGGNGGPGTWNAANRNWAAAPGAAFNDTWQGHVGVFAGASGGTVTIEGTQAFEELRFETDGYVLQAGTAGALATTGGFSVIDAADGVTATINAGIGGTGGLTKTGPGTLELGGANSYAGSTLVAEGRLRGSSASLHGNIENDATLEFHQSDAGTYAGMLSGAGTLEKTGSGRLILSGDNSGFAGPTHLLAGDLNVAHLLTGSVVTVASGATLSGTGAVGGIVAQAGATVAPGNSIGTLAVDGDVQFVPGSTYAAEVSAAGADRILADGSASVAGTLALTNLGGDYQFNSTYVLLQADGGRTGTFDSTTGLSGFGARFLPRIVYTGTQVQLLLAPNQLSAVLGSNAASPNQSGFIDAFDAAVEAGLDPLPFEPLFELDPAGALAGINMLTGEIYATAARVALDDERLVREGIFGRLRTAQDTQASGMGAWGQLFASWGSGDGDGNAADHDADRTGFAIGLDGGGQWENGSWRVGLVGHYVRTSLDVDDRASDADIDRAGGGVYAGFEFGQLRTRFGATYSDLELDSRRLIAFTGFSDTARAKIDGNALQAFGEIAFRLSGSDEAFIEPFLGVSIAEIELDGFSETGGPAALTVADQDHSLRTATLGLRGAMMAGGGLRLGGMAGARHASGDRDTAAFAALSAAPDQDFVVRSAEIPRWAAVVAVDAAMDLTPGLNLAVGYSGLIGDEARDHAVKGTLSLRF